MVIKGQCKPDLIRRLKKIKKPKSFAKLVHEADVLGVFSMTVFGQEAAEVAEAATEVAAEAAEATEEAAVEETPVAQDATEEAAAS